MASSEALQDRLGHDHFDDDHHGLPDDRDHDNQCDNGHVLVVVSVFVLVVVSFCVEAANECADDHESSIEHAGGLESAISIATDDASSWFRVSSFLDHC